MDPIETVLVCLLTVSTVFFCFWSLNKFISGHFIKTFAHDYFIICQTRIHVREETVADKIDLRTGQSCQQCNHKLFFFVPAHFLLISTSFEMMLVIAFQGQMITPQKLKGQFYGPCMLQPELC